MSDVITTKRLVLRPLVAADAGAAIEMLNNYEVSKWLARVPHPFSANNLRILNDDGSSRWPDLVAITSENQLIGAISLRADHLGYWLGQDHWGRGFGTEAVRAGCRFVFENSDAPKILSGVFDQNIASRKILEGLGFAQGEKDYAYSTARDCEVRNVEYYLTRTAWDARA